MGYNLNFSLTPKSKTNRVDRQRKERITELRSFQILFFLSHSSPGLFTNLKFIGFSFFNRVEVYSQALLRNDQSWYYIEDFF